MIYYLVSAGYDKEKNCVYLRFYNDETQKLAEWYDETFKAYCLSSSPQNFIGIPVDRFKEVIKYDALNDKNVTLTRAEFENPTIVKKTHNIEEIEFWENHIKFQMCYIYDNDMHIGMPYNIQGGKLIPLVDTEAEGRTEELLKLFEEKKITKDLIKLFEYPVPDFKRASLDIEVLNEVRKMPRPEVANLPILCVCLKTSDDRRVTFLLLQPDKKLEKYPDVDELYIFPSEKEMLVALFEYVQRFPFILTFNGDGFDLIYLRNRALRFGIPITEIPFELSGISMFMRSAIHLDLYRFFSVAAIRNYAFQGKYKDADLNTLSKLFLNKEKLNHDKKMVGDMDYYELINYCMRDAELTYGLSSFDGNVVMNLIVAISRISRMPMEEVSRKAVGRWIGSFLFYLHRQLNYLIPNPQDINSMKGAVTTKAMIKGKQYQGAIVITPKGGVYFKVKVVDFGSLYPSIIKLYNIGYQTINCPHGAQWQKLSNTTKKFIWLLCHLSQNKELNNQCHVEERMKLMKNIEKEIENTTKNIEGKTENTSMKWAENFIENIWKTQKSKGYIENEVNSQLKSGEQKNQMNIENILENGKTNEEKSYENNLLNLKVQNVDDVEILMNELLKYITSMGEMISREETFISLSQKWIGKNYNFFVPIVTELFTLSNCGSNKFAGLPHWICIKHKALESIFIGSLRDLRLGWYKQKSKDKNLTTTEKSWYKCIEQAIKVFMNASYGFFAQEGASGPFACPSVSEEIANIGRSIISATSDKAKELEIYVIYGDTDSLMLFNPNDEQIKALQEWALKTYQIDLELDKEYRFACFSGRKKNYLGVKPSGEVDIKGLTGKKSHTPLYFKKTFEEIKTVLKGVQYEDDVPKAKEAISKLVLQSYKKLKSRQWDSLDDLAFHMTVNKKLSEYGRKKIGKDGKETRIAIPQHIKAVHQLEAAGYVFEAGTTISFVKTNNADGVMALELAKDEDIDVDKYIEFLKATFGQILDPLELDFSEILGYKKLSAFY